MISRENYYKLLEKYLSGKCSEEEKELLFSYKEDFELKEIEWNETAMGDREEVGQKIHGRIRSSLRRPYSLHTVNYLSAAAIILAVLGAGYLLFQNNNKPSDVMTGNKIVAKDFNPASNVAFITINGAQAIALDASDSSRDISHNGIVIGTLHKDQISLNKTYVRSDYNISTPKGGKFKIILPDKTLVWLNSQSEISVEASGFSTDRRLALSGEAYFEVTKDKHLPFMVKVQSSEITVLGTHFNVKSNSSNNQVHTTLFEGSVSIRNGGTTKMLKPGQEAISNQSSDSETDAVTIKEVDLDKKAGWTKGYFIFDKEDIKQVMQEISKWYNVEVQYRGDVSNDLFKGKIRNDLKLTEVLGILELNGFHFELMKDTVIIEP